MTHYTDAIRNGTCTLLGCYAPRHVSKSGRIYARCDLHYRQQYQHAATRPPGDHRPQRHPSAVGKRVNVMVIDWATERIWRVEGVVCEDEAMPKTHGQLLKLLAEAGEMGIYVCKPQPFREEDLYDQEVEEIRT